MTTTDKTGCSAAKEPKPDPNENNLPEMLERTKNNTTPTMLAARYPNLKWIG